MDHAKKYGEIDGEVTYTKTRLDKEDDVVCYEVEFYNNGTEYEYKINAKTGEIIDWDIDD